MRDDNGHTIPSLREFALQLGDAVLVYCLCVTWAKKSVVCLDRAIEVGKSQACTHHSLLNVTIELKNRPKGRAKKSDVAD